MGRRNDIDWDAIERDFRLGQFTLRQLAKKYSVEASSISRKVEKEGWVQDLTEEVRGRTRAALLSNATDCNTTDAIEAAVQTNIRIIREHQARIGRAQKMVDALLDELQDATESRDEIEAAIEEETREPGQAKKRAAMLRAIALPARAATLVNLSAATKTFMGLERQAFNLDANNGDGRIPIISNEPLSDAEWEAKYCGSVE
jgi:hypothetical protein